MKSRHEVGEIVEGTITAIRPYGAIMIFDDDTLGLLHISEVANTYIKNIYRYLIIGKTYQVKILSIGEDGFSKVSITKITPEEKELYHSQFYKRTKINEERINFDALKEKLDEWVKEGK